MADIADTTSDKMEVIEAAYLGEIRKKASAIPPGEPGECDRCGEQSPRLVNGVCSPCRDKYKLP